MVITNLTVPVTFGDIWRFCYERHISAISGTHATKRTINNFVFDRCWASNIFCKRKKKCNESINKCVFLLMLSQQHSYKNNLIYLFINSIAKMVHGYVEVHKEEPCLSKPRQEENSFNLWNPLSWIFDEKPEALPWCTDNKYAATRTR